METGRDGPIDPNSDTSISSRTHPIQRTPEDIIREIFDWLFVLDERERGRMKKGLWNQWNYKDLRHLGVILSHVCRFWRQIAIDTPKLWSRIRFVSSLPLEIMLDHWNQMMSRLRRVDPCAYSDSSEHSISVPLTIDLFLENEECSEYLSHFPIREFEKVASFNIYFSDEKFLKTLLDWIKDSPILIKPIDFLGIYGMRTNTKSNPFISYRVNDLVDQFSPTTVTVESVPYGISLFWRHQGRTIPTIRNLNIIHCGISTPCVQGFAQRLPFLDHLYVERVDMSLTPIILHEIRSLDINCDPYRSHFFTEDYLHCPRFERLRLRCDKLSDYYSFIKAHSTITTLGLEGKIVTQTRTFKRLAVLAPQITHLMMRSSDLRDFQSKPKAYKFDHNSSGTNSDRQLIQSLQQSMAQLQLNSNLSLPFAHLECITIVKNNQYLHPVSHESRTFSRGLTRLVRRRYLPGAGDQTGESGRADGQGKKQGLIRALRLQDGLQPCPELDGISYSYITTEGRIFREYVFSPPL